MKKALKDLTLLGKFLFDETMDILRRWVKLAARSTTIAEFEENM